MISGAIKCMKPEKEMYQLLLPMLGQNQLIFIDDQKENRITAQSYGIQTIDCPKRQTFLGLGTKPDFTIVRAEFEKIKNNSLFDQATVTSATT